MRPLFYCRASTDKQELSIESQLQQVDYYSRMKSLPLGLVFVDEDVSGGIPLSERPGGGLLLAEAGKGSIIVVAKLDRLFRSVADAALCMEQWAKRGIELVSIAEGFDTRSIYGRAMAQMACVFAELERALIKERTRAALQAKRVKGERISGHLPFGWDLHADGKSLVANQSEQYTIELMRGWKLDGLSYQRIAATLTANGIPSKGGGAWHKTAVERVMKRRS